MVIGVPTVKRSVHNYLNETLYSLTSNLFDDELERLLIVVFVGELQDTAWSDQLFEALRRDYAYWIDRGVLEVIAPPSDFYPDLDVLVPTLGDSQARMKLVL